MLRRSGEDQFVISMISHFIWVVFSLVVHPIMNLFGGASGFFAWPLFFVNLVVQLVFLQIDGRIRKASAVTRIYYVVKAIYVLAYMITVLVLVFF